MNATTLKRLTALTVAATCCGCVDEGPARLAAARSRAAVMVAEAELARESASGGSQTPGERGASAPRFDPPESPRIESAVPARTEPAAAPRRVRLLYFGARWCAACRGNEPTLAALAAAGWKIGPDEAGHVQTVDADARPDLLRRHGVTTIPCWVLVEDGCATRQAVGVLDPFAVGRLFER